MSEDTQTRIQETITAHPVVLYMKGSSDTPQCGFSAQVIQVLNLQGYPYHTVNVLEDEDIREGIKTFSNWPTIPQLYIQSEFVGGCDIVLKLYKTGELKTKLAKALNTETPPNTPNILDLSPEEAQQMIEKYPDAKLLDVRSSEEWDITHLPNAELVDQDKAETLISNCPKTTPLICMCHHGLRSISAAEFFKHHGFETVATVRGGIDAWAETIDSSLKRY